MNSHRHLSPEEITALVADAGEQRVEALAGCVQCEREADSARDLFAEVRRVDATAGATTEWDDLLLRKRIRDAVAREKPHAFAWFARFGFLKPALVTATAILFALVILNPASRLLDRGAAPNPGVAQKTLPSWAPLPEEADDEGLALLARWTPNADEIAIAGCQSSCVAGLSTSEEEGILRSIGALTGKAAASAPNPL